MLVGVLYSCSDHALVRQCVDDGWIIICPKNSLSLYFVHISMSYGALKWLFTIMVYFLLLQKLHWWSRTKYFILSWFIRLLELYRMWDLVADKLSFHSQVISRPLFIPGRANIYNSLLFRERDNTGQNLTTSNGTEFTSFMLLCASTVLMWITKKPQVLQTSFLWGHRFINKIRCDSIISDHLCLSFCFSLIVGSSKTQSRRQVCTSSQWIFLKKVSFNIYHVRLLLWDYWLVIHSFLSIII